MSTAMVDCPYCERRVLANDGRCPACNRDLNDEAAAQRHVLIQKASAIAKAARAKGASYGEIETELIRLGTSEDLIREIMLEVEGKTPQAMAEKNDMDMRHGVYWLLGGLLVTGVTYLIARSSENGGMYVVAWGAVATGGIQFMRAWLNSK
ncbi:MAG: hypothetical protein AB1705_20360 [Verrucomicrobiota bacterium]